MQTPAQPQSWEIDERPVTRESVLAAFESLGYNDERKNYFTPREFARTLGVLDIPFQHGAPPETPKFLTVLENVDFLGPLSTARVLLIQNTGGSVITLGSNTSLLTISSLLPNGLGDVIVAECSRRQRITLGMYADMKCVALTKNDPSYLWLLFKRRAETFFDERFITVRGCPSQQRDAMEVRKHFILAILHQLPISPPPPGSSVYPWSVNLGASFDEVSEPQPDEICADDAPSFAWIKRDTRMCIQYRHPGLPVFHCHPKGSWEALGFTPLEAAAVRPPGPPAAEPEEPIFRALAKACFDLKIFHTAPPLVLIGRLIQYQRAAFRSMELGVGVGGTGDFSIRRWCERYYFFYDVLQSNFHAMFQVPPANFLANIAPYEQEARKNVKIAIAAGFDPTFCLEFCISKFPRNQEFDEHVKGLQRRVLVDSGFEPTPSGFAWILRNRTFDAFALADILARLDCRRLVFELPANEWEDYRQWVRSTSGGAGLKGLETLARVVEAPLEPLRRRAVAAIVRAGTHCLYKPGGVGFLACRDRFYAMSSARALPESEGPSPKRRRLD